MPSRSALFFVLAGALVASALAAPLGNCSNDADVAALKSHGPDEIQALMAKCAIGCVGDADCTAKCATTALGTSAPCSGCFGADAKCMLSNCALKCLNPSSAGCMKCHNDKCIDAFKTCSGVMPEPLPQFVRDILADMDAAGKCDNDADKAALDAHTADLHDKVQKCATGCLGAADCTTKCVTTALGTSAPCSGCFGADAKCMKSNCALKCLNPSSAGCLKCHQDKCASGYEQCSGIPTALSTRFIDQIIAAVAADTGVAAPQDVADPAGACQNDADQAAFKAHDVQTEVTKCGKKCLAAEECSTKCVAEALGTSQACSSCFGKDANCMRKNCLYKCINPFGSGCVKCHEENCAPAFVTCSGEKI